MNFQDAKERAEILKALAHPVRLVLVDELSRGDRCLCELAPLVKVDQSVVSRHLAQLKRAGIVSERREGAKSIHRLACPCILQALDCSVDVVKRRSRSARAT